MVIFGKSFQPTTLVYLIGAALLAVLVHQYWKKSVNYDQQTPKTFDEILEGLDVRETLLDHSKEFDKPVIYHVTEGVWMAVGYAIGNSIMIEGPDGLIIIDTTEDPVPAGVIWKEFRRLSSKPLKAIIYTHNHPDHVMGTPAFIDDITSPPEIWSHHTLTSRQRETFITGFRMVWGSDRQFGPHLGKYLINSGLGPKLTMPTDLKALPIPPNRLVVDEIQHEVLAGLNVTFLHVPGETSDQIAIWLPDKKVLMPGDNIYKAFPNLYAIRGTPPRDPLNWSKSLEKMRSLNAEYLAPSHTRPVQGQKEIYELFTVYMSGIEFIHDQATRLINKRMHPDEIARTLRLPKAIRTHRYWREHYGRIEWAVKAVYERYVGWFSGDPVDLLPYPPAEKSARMLELVGVDGLLYAAEAALIKSDFQWALELASHVYRIDENNMRAKDLRLQALRRLAEQQENAPARNFYLTTALDDYKLIRVSIDGSALMREAPAMLIFDVMKRKLNAELAEDIEMQVGFIFTDTNEIFKLSVEWSILHFSSSTIDNNDLVTQDNCDALITTELKTLKQILLQNLSIDMAVATDKIKLEGHGRRWKPLAAILKFFSLFDQLPR